MEKGKIVMVNGEQIDLDAFVKGFRKASDIIRMEKPSFVFAPVSGSVPFIDILSIVDRKFNVNNVAYIPNSSRFANREELMAEWYAKFYSINEIGKPIKIICVDEVLSGSSAIVGYKQFHRSLDERAGKKAQALDTSFETFEKFRRKLGKNIGYKILGIAERGHERNVEFRRLKNRGEVYEVDFDSVPTIDNVDYNYLRFKVASVQPNGKPIYLPEIERFDITPKYIAFLQAIASYVGVDPASVGTVSLAKIEQGLKLAKAG